MSSRVGFVLHSIADVAPFNKISTRCTNRVTGFAHPQGDANRDHLFGGELIQKKSVSSHCSKWSFFLTLCFFVVLLHLVWFDAVFFQGQMPSGLR